MNHLTSVSVTQHVSCAVCGSFLLQFKSYILIFQRMGVVRYIIYDINESSIDVSKTGSFIMFFFYLRFLPLGELMACINLFFFFFAKIQLWGAKLI